MRYTPTDTELNMLQTASLDERFMYAITRMVECEEVWSLGDEDGWTVHELDGSNVIPIWPYQALAENYAVNNKADLLPQSTSLEQFIYSLLEQCTAAEIELDILPSNSYPGKRLTAAALYDVLHNMLDTGQYFLEG